MKNEIDIRREISRLLESQLLAVLSTHQNGQPYANIVAFTVSKDIAEIYFATSRSTSKFTNIEQDKRVAMLIDNRSNSSADFQEAAAVTVVGRAEELKEQDREKVMDTYLDRHPNLKGFIQAPSTALIQVTVSKYILVNRFHDVFELDFEG